MTASLYKHIYTDGTNVRIDDINYGNHLCHTRIINIIHNTRALFLKSHHLTERDCFGYSLILTALNIRYKSQCYFDDKLKITMSIGDIERSTFSLNYEVLNETTGKIAAQATLVMVFLDPKSHKITKIPQDFTNLIENINNSEIYS